jgi:RNA methyltransferase, TrmH family
MPEPRQRGGPPRPPGAAAELRLHGFNACVAVFRHRPGAIRKLWLAEERVPELRELMAWCARQRIGYRIVGREDLQRLSGSQHHEGVCLAVERAAPLGLQAWLRGLAPGPAVALWLDGVGNPHNLGAILRSSAHFGAAGVLLPGSSGLGLSGAAARIAEGGAEAVPLVDAGAVTAAFADLRAAGFVPLATVVRGGQDLFATALPERLLLVMGAEGEGVDPALAAACERSVGIPGSGAVESLNVSAATAVLLAEWFRARR